MKSRFDIDAILKLITEFAEEKPQSLSQILLDMAKAVYPLNPLLWYLPCIGAGLSLDEAEKQSNKPLVIGISGKKRSGKDTLAQMLIDIIGKDAVKIGHADALKDEAGEILHLTHTGHSMGYYRYAIDHPESKEWYRPFLIRLTEHRRSQDPNYWAKKFTEKVALSNAKVIIAPDIRWKNDADNIIDNLGGMMLRLHNSNIPKDENADSSETEMDDYERFDLYVPNDVGLDRLKENAGRLVDIIKRRLGE
jgi:phosphomevalonate kinase